MCGRYALALRPSQIRQMLQDDDMPVDDAPADEGDGAPRQSYNFAPGYHGVVYRADVPDRGAGTGTGSGPWGRAARHGGADGENVDDAAGTAANPNATEQDHDAAAAAAEQTPSSTDQQHPDHHRQHDDATTATSLEEQRQKYILQAMKWGLVPFWTKRKPDYGSMLKTINCRDDSLAGTGGMWASMKGRKRCVVIGEGFYEWLKVGPKEKVPHYVKRKDGKLMCFAGLWDCVRYESEEDAAEGTGDGLYTYTIVTTDSNAQLRFLHDRMPVILDPGSEALFRWVNPGRGEWRKDLQALLRPFAGELVVYPVSKEVGKVGNNSPNMVLPVSSRENKANIANFFANAAKKGAAGGVKPEVEVKEESGTQGKTVDEVQHELNVVDRLVEMFPQSKGIKREAGDVSPGKGEPPAKKTASGKTASPVKERQAGRGKISATSNASRSPAKAKAKADGSQKITKFFGNSA